MRREEVARLEKLESKDAILSYFIRLAKREYQEMHKVYWDTILVDIITALVEDRENIQKELEHYIKNAPPSKFLLSPTDLWIE